MPEPNSSPWSAPSRPRVHAAGHRYARIQPLHLVLDLLPRFALVPSISNPPAICATAAFRRATSHRRNAARRRYHRAPARLRQHRHFQPVRQLRRHVVFDVGRRGIEGLPLRNRQAGLKFVRGVSRSGVAGTPVRSGPRSGNKLAHRAVGFLEIGLRDAHHIFRRDFLDRSKLRNNSRQSPLAMVRSTRGGRCEFVMSFSMPCKMRALRAPLPLWWAVRRPRWQGRVDHGLARFPSD